MPILIDDIRHVVRSLARSPAYAVLTMFTLALGIGANTAIFSVLHGVVLKPLPYPKPDRLLFITSTFPAQNLDHFWISPPEWAEFRERNHSFQDVGGYRIGAVNLGTERPRRITSAVVTPQLLPVLGVPPLRGRLFTEADSRPGAENVAILSYKTWKTDFGAEEGAVGRAVPVDGVQTRIVGIMPQGYDVHDERIEIYVPLTIDPSTFPTQRASHFLYLIGRLRDGIFLTQAQADLDAMIDQWRTLSGNRHSPNRRPPESFTGRMPPAVHLLQMQPMRSDLIGGIRTPLWVLQGAVGFVLLIACANLAHMILARAGYRQKEYAIRTALGANRIRLIRQFLTEGVLLSLGGGLLGAAVGLVGMNALVTANADSIPRAREIAFDWIVMIFALGVSVATGLFAGLVPLLHLRPSAVSQTLQESGARITAGPRTRLRSGLVIAEVALAVVLVVGAGLLARSFQKLMTVDPGFNRDRLTTFGVVLPAATYSTPEARGTFFARLTDHLAALPGVVGVAAMTGLPPNRVLNSNSVEIEGYTPTSDQPEANIEYFQTVTTDYLRTMGIPIVRGRGFEPADIVGGPVLLVNETLAKRFFGDRGLDAVGQRIKPYVGYGVDASFTIVGVVRDVKQGGLSKKAGTELYLLDEQGPRLIHYAPSAMNVVLRSALPAESLARVIEETVREQDATLPIVKLKTMNAVFEDVAARSRLLAQLLSFLAGLALALAGVGTYGILSHSVSERTRDIGIHMALGATRGSVLGMVLGQGLRMTSVGLMAGLVASLGLTRLLQAELFEVRPTDPTTLLAVIGTIAVIAVLACYVPARRATRVDPLVSLRSV